MEFAGFVKKKQVFIVIAVGECSEDSTEKDPASLEKHAERPTPTRVRSQVNKTS